MLRSLALSGARLTAAELLEMGTIRESPSKMIKGYEPLSKYLASKSLPMGRINNARSVAEMIDLIDTGKVDFLFESPCGAVRIMMKTEASPDLIYEKDGVRLLLVRDGVDHDALKQTLLGMEADADAAAALESMETQTGFSEFAGDPRAIMNEVRADLGL